MKKGNEQGSIMVMVVVIAAVGLIVALAAMRMSQFASKQAGDQRVGVSLLNIAEAGKEDAWSRIKGSTFVPVAGQTVTAVAETPFGGGAYVVSCRANSDLSMAWLTSTGMYQGKSKSIEVALAITPCHPDSLAAEAGCQNVCVAAQTIGGGININPNNSTDNEFVLTKPDGSQITRDDLKNGTVTSYTGVASRVHVKPKGNGNQNGLTVDGQVFALQNGHTYDITAKVMTVKLYNDGNGKGNSMGKWVIEITAYNGHVGDAGTGTDCSSDCGDSQNNGTNGSASGSCVGDTRYSVVGWKEL